MSEFAFLSGGGEMGERIRSFPWELSPLGTPEHWPQGLRTALRTLLTTQHPVFIFWGSEHLCFYNDAYRHSIGPEKHPSAEIWKIIGPQIDQVMGGRGATWHENQLIPMVRHGELQNVYWTYSYGPIDERSSPNGIGGVLVICTETTQQVVTNNRLAAERERFAALFEQAPTFMAVLRGPNHVIELTNPAFLSLVGHRSVAGQTVADAFPDAIGQGYLAILDTVYRSAEAFSGTGARFPMHALSDSTPTGRYVDFVCQPILDEHGKVTGIFISGADVSVRVLTEATLLEREEQLRQANTTLEQRIVERTAQLMRSEALIQTIHLHSFECHAVLLEVENGQFRYEEVNPATLRLLGKTREEVIGRTIEEVCGREIAAQVYPHLSACLAANAPHHYERVRGERILEAIATPVPQEPSKAKRLVVNARDVTESRRLEQQLRQSQKMDAVGNLTGGLAHDFNNLLAAISSSLDMLKTRLMQGRIDDLDRYVHAAQGAANRAAALTHRLLAFSRRQTLDSRPADVNSLVSGMEDLIRRTIRPEIKMEFIRASALWSALVDVNQLENALLNLCINSGDAMPHGGKLVIETTNCSLAPDTTRDRDLEPGQYVLLCVTDTGTGMQPDVIARAFDPFFTTKPLGKGTGLGLSMVYGFARQSGGHVHIDSEIDVGTRVCIYLPRHYGNPATSEKSELVLDLAQTTRAAQGTTVLVVDDEPTVRMIVAEVLQDIGYSVPAIQ
jgi:PAS domain S-box-containing protein